MGLLHCRCNYVYCEPACNFLVGQPGYITMSRHLHLLLYQNFLTLRYNSIQPQEQISQAQSTQATPLNMARYRKAVSSALWIQVTLVVCYLPYVVAVFLTPQGKLTLHN